MREKDQTSPLTLHKDILAIQLLEVAVFLIKRIRKYAEENGIVLGESYALNRLLKEAETLLNEANYVDRKLKSRKLPTNFFDDRDPEELPEPPIIITIVGIRGRE